MELLPEELKHLFPVGRLDADATGVLLFTNDGQTAQMLLHPKYQISRCYEVRIGARLNEDEVKIIKRGVIIDGRRAIPKSLRRIEANASGEIWNIELCEGRYHEVKRIFAAIGHNVLSLERVSYAGIDIGNLKSGQWRELTNDEIEKMKKRVGD